MEKLDSEKQDLLNKVKKPHTMEGVKLRYDAYKHLTTLNTGSILILFTLLEKILKTQLWKSLILAALTSLIISVITSIAMMFLLAMEIQRDVGEDVTGVELNIYTSIGLTSLICFLVGILCIVVFTFRNLYA